MMKLTLVIIGRCLFDVDLTADAARLGNAIGSLIENFRFGQIGPIGRFLAKMNRSYQREQAGHMAVLDEAMYAIIRERRADGEDRGDLLSMLLAAQEEDEESGMLEGMSDQQVRNEAITLFSAGHETTANALTWTFFLLSQHPEIEARLHAQLDQVLGDPANGTMPTLAHLPDLPYVRQVFSESMRLYPPAWIMGRTAIADDVVAGVPIHAGTALLVSQYVTHRNPRYWPNPDQFDPERFAPGVKPAHAYAYFPFGGGARRCIGEPLAWMEGELILAAVAHRYRLGLVPGTVVVPQPRITLRVEGGLPMILEKRG
jgi:cytochrome P450